MSELRCALLLLLPVVALAAAGLRGLAGARGRRIGLAMLAALTAASLWAQVGWNTRDGRDLLNAYDLYHYYIGSRYRAELGTSLLYECTLVADRQGSRPRLLGVAQVRDLDTYELVGSGFVVQRGEGRCAAAFTPSRWRQFRSDLSYFRKKLSAKEWESVLIDRGTNASPIWDLFGGTVARLVPVKAIAAAAAIDILALLGLFAAAVWAFGAEAALVAACFLLTCYSTRWPPIGGALFRYDWVAAAGVAVCLLRRQRPALSGAAFAYAAGVRIFPFFMACGLAASAVWKTLRHRGLPARDRRFALGFLGTMAALVALATAVSGPGSFRQFGEKISVHAAAENVSVMRVGLPVALAWRGETPDSDGESMRMLREKRDRMSDQERVAKGAALVAALAVMAVARARRIRDEDLVLLGVALIPLGLQISYYYYVFLTIPALLNAADLPRRGAALSLTALCWLNAAAWWTDERDIERYTVLSVGSVAVCAYAILLIVGIAWRARAEDRADPQPPSAQRGVSETILTSRP